MPARMAGETKDVLAEARGVDRAPARSPCASRNADMGFTYRNSAAPHDMDLHRRCSRGTPGDPLRSSRAMDEVCRLPRDASADQGAHRRLDVQEPEGGHSAWKLIDAAGCRGFRVGGAHGLGDALQLPDQRPATRPADIERLGEEVRRRVKDNSGYELHWEIKRFGVAV
jgi:UDP-N-acetylmuramate dehydrogenase